MYLNPGNEGFAGIIAGEYVDKTGLISLFNAVLGTPRKLVCSTRPRRFGKTFAAEALVAYYSCGCDSRPLFEGLAISGDATYGRHINAYNLIRLDMTAFLGADDVSSEVTRQLLTELRELCPEAGVRTGGGPTELTTALADIVAHTGKRFVFVVDEWDAPLREQVSKASQRNWITLLRSLFKNFTFTAQAVAGAYITGILPVVRYGSQSALSDFDEYTVLLPGPYAPYVGFVEEEVDSLCVAHRMDASELRRWYDGYELPTIDEATGKPAIVRAYAPYSVMQACQRGIVGSYWANSEAFDSLRVYVDIDFEGLQQSILKVVSGTDVDLKTGTFANDMHEVKSADDVLTLLCHLGYLAYDARDQTCRVPNEEVRSELTDAVMRSRHPQIARIVRQSEELLAATLERDEDKVADALGRAHDECATPLLYNNEESLRLVVRYAYLAAADHYVRVEELPGGHGFADLCYLPRRGSGYPALLIELKWNKPSDAAIAQIRERDYPAPLRNWGGRVLVVGIAYDSQSKRHSCRIEEL